MKGKKLNNKSEIRCSLLNYEGDVLWAKRVDEDEFVIYDQDNSIVEILDMKQLLDFLDGKIELTDSLGKTWNYYNEHRDAKPSHTTLYKFING